MTKVSIIMPAYNAEKYIRQALDSACNQSLKDIEIIVVNDCSSDSTPIIINEYAEKEERIVVINNNTNLGMLYSRNIGLQKASGKYIMFLDSDDYLETNACEKLSEKMDDGNWDIYQFGAALNYDESLMNLEGHANLETYLSVPTKYFPMSQTGLIKLFTERKISWNVWNKIYRKDILDKALQFYNNERVQYAEDFLIFTMALCFTKSYSGTSHRFINYRIGSGISTQVIIPSKNMESYALIGKVYSLLKEWVPQTGLNENLRKMVLNYSHDYIVSEVFLIFVHQIFPEDSQRFLNVVLSYWDLKTVIEEYAWFIFFDYSRIQQEDAIALLQQSLPSFHVKEVHTIGMYYHRMFNGGVERVISLLAPILLGAGFNVVIITDSGPTKEDYFLPEQVTHIKFPSCSSESKERISCWQNIIEEYGIDAVIYHAWLDDNIVIDSMAVKSMGIPFIIHGHNSFQFIYRYLEPGWKWNWFKQSKIYAFADLVIVLSEVDLAWCNALGIKAVQTINPLTYSLDEMPVSDLASHNVCWVARLSPEKQYYDAIDIAKIVHESVPDFKLHIVGKADDDNILTAAMEYVNDKKMSDFVIFEGFQENVDRFYLQSSVALVTSEFEGFSMSFQEAKVFGLPVVTYELPNMTMIRQPDSGVIVVPQRDIKTAALKIIELLNDEDKRKNYGEMSRNSIEKLYDVDFAGFWSEIIALSQTPKENEVPLYQRDALSVSLKMLVDNCAYNFEQMAGKTSVFQQKNELIASLKKTNREILSSSSYRLGQLILWPFCTLKDKIKKKIRNKRA